MICMASGDKNKKKTKKKRKRIPHAPPKTPTDQAKQDMRKIEPNDFYFLLPAVKKQGVNTFASISLREKNV